MISLSFIPKRIALYIFAVLIIIFVAVTSNAPAVTAIPTTTTTTPITTNLTDLRDECGHTLKRPSGFFERHFDWRFLKRVLRHWNPFSNRIFVNMQFFLYKRDFPECGREIKPNVDETLEASGFDAKHQTRIIIHGWMSQSKGSLNRSVKNAYLSLTMPANETTGTTPNDNKEENNGNSKVVKRDTEQEEEEGGEREVNGRKEEKTKANKKKKVIFYSASSSESKEDDDDDELTALPYYEDFNIIVVDWSVISSNVNYFSVVDLIEELGFLLADFVRYLNTRAGLHYDDVYLIGHSLGAQIAGSAGKQVQPFKFNTIFALDPAGPKFRDLSDEYRIDPSDAQYVESIQTSSSLGFKDPVGHATFYPNYGHDQKKCYIYGCSHSRAHDYFAESITSKKGFWGTLCKRESKDVWIISNTGAQFRMGGEPSTPKRGTFYVKTNDKPPYAMGRMKSDLE